MYEVILWYGFDYHILKKGPSCEKAQDFAKNVKSAETEESQYLQMARFPQQTVNIAL